MAMGLIGIGQQKRDQAMAGFGEVSSLESKRNQTNESIKAQDRAAEQGKVGMALSTGLMAATMINPIAGAAVGLGMMLF